MRAIYLVTILLLAASAASAKPATVPAPTPTELAMAGLISAIPADEQTEDQKEFLARIMARGISSSKKIYEPPAGGGFGACAIPDGEDYTFTLEVRVQCLKDQGLTGRRLDRYTAALKAIAQALAATKRLEETGTGVAHLAANPKQVYECLMGTFDETASLECLEHLAQGGQITGKTAVKLLKAADALEPTVK